MLYAVAEETAAIVRAHRHSRAWRGAPGFHRDSRESTPLCRSDSLRSTRGRDAVSTEVRVAVTHTANITATAGVKNQVTVRDEHKTFTLRSRQHTSSKAVHRRMQVK